MKGNEPTHNLTRSRWLIGLMAGIALFQAGAALRALQLPDALAAQVRLIPALEFVTGTLWALIAALLAGALWRRSPKAVRQSMWFLVGFSIYSLLRLFLFTQTDYDRGRMPFLVMAVAIGLAFMAAGTLRPKIRATENIDNDLKPQN
ncbi:MAG: hypothetical protein K8L97_14840 [Anaerolineae bacterium]|nr:hypothetical protein [Anaerolineae bacterium]